MITTKDIVDDLCGFEVIRVNEPADMRSGYALRVTRNLIRLSNDANRLLGDPSWVNVFIDRNRRRIMVKAAGEGMPNAVGNSPWNRKNPAAKYIKSKPVVEAVQKLTEYKNEPRTIFGREAKSVDPAVIFEVEA